MEYCHSAFINAIPYGKLEANCSMFVLNNPDKHCTLFELWCWMIVIKTTSDSCTGIGKHEHNIGSAIST